MLLVGLLAKIGERLDNDQSFLDHVMDVSYLNPLLLIPRPLFNVWGMAIHKRKLIVGRRINER